MAETDYSWVGPLIQGYFNYRGDKKNRDMFGESKPIPLTPEEQWMFDKKKELFEYSPARDYAGSMAHGALKSNHQMRSQYNPQFASKAMGDFQMPQFQSNVDLDSLPKFWEKGQYSSGVGGKGGGGPVSNEEPVIPSVDDIRGMMDREGMQRPPHGPAAGGESDPFSWMNGLDPTQPMTPQQQDMFMDGLRKHGPKTAAAIASVFGGALTGKAAQWLVNQVMKLLPNKSDEEIAASIVGGQLGNQINAIIRDSIKKGDTGNVARESPWLDPRVQGRMDEPPQGMGFDPSLSGLL